MVEHPSRPSVVRLSAVALHNVTRLSEFRKFLIVNQEEIERVSGGYRISWSKLLASAEVKALNFRDNDGKEISPRLAAQIWRRVRGKHRDRIVEDAIHPASAVPFPVFPANHVVRHTPTSTSHPLFGKPVKSGSLESALIDLVNLETKGQPGRTPDGAVRIATNLTRERDS